MRIFSRTLCISKSGSSPVVKKSHVTLVTLCAAWSVKNYHWTKVSQNKALFIITDESHVRANELWDVWCLQLWNQILKVMFCPILNFSGKWSPLVHFTGYLTLKWVLFQLALTNFIYGSQILLESKTRLWF